ncbi:hypothetical protein YC2023_095205 [Brassica napus]
MEKMGVPLLILISRSLSRETIGGIRQLAMPPTLSEILYSKSKKNNNNNNKKTKRVK